MIKTALQASKKKDGYNLRDFKNHLGMAAMVGIPLGLGALRFRSAARSQAKNRKWWSDYNKRSAKWNKKNDEWWDGFRDRQRQRQQQWGSNNNYGRGGSSNYGRGGSSRQAPGGAWGSTQKSELRGLGLNVDNITTKAEYKKAWRKAAMRWHPDRTGGDESKFKVLNNLNDAFMKSDEFSKLAFIRLRRVLLSNIPAGGWDKLVR